jgi:hypothetical protein
MISPYINTTISASINAGGKDSILKWIYYDGVRVRVHKEYVGENNIEPNTPYIGELINGKFIVEKENT